MVYKGFFADFGLQSIFSRHIAISSPGVANFCVCRNRFSNELQSDMVMEIRGFPLLLTIWLLLQVLASHTLAIRTEPLLPSGLAKDAWPELSGKDSIEALKEIKRVVDNVFIQEPTSVEDLPEVIGGNADDVWIYTDGSGVVVGIPQRAPWHPNRLRPGWTELKGMDYKEAIQKILKEATGVKVLFGPEGMVVSSDYDLARVVVFVDPSGKVAQVPHLG